MARDDSRNCLLEAAGQVFAEKGYRTATVREICDLAKMNVASVNYYFGGKEQLYIEAVKHADQPLHGQTFTPEWSVDTPPEEKLQTFIRMFLQRTIGHRAESWRRQLMMREILAPSGACKELVESHFRQRFGLLLSIVDELLPEPVSEAKRHQVAFSVLGQCLHYHVAGTIVELLVGREELTQHYSIEQLTDHILQMTLAGIRVIAAEPEKNARLDETHARATEE